MKYHFTYYLHDNYTRGELADFLADPKFGDLPSEVAVEIAEKRPFYEVGILCEYDTETKEVTIVKAST